MERKVKKLLTAVGILTGLSVAAIPLTSYAVSPSTKNGSVAVTIAPIITLEVSVDPASQGSSDEEMLLKLTPNMVGEGSFSAKVSTNKAYKLSLHATNTNLAYEGTAEEAAANFIPGTGNVTAGENSWGVKLASDSSYKAVPNAATVFYTGANPVSDAVTQFNVGIAAGPSLLQGRYSGTVIVTASNS